MRNILRHIAFLLFCFLSVHLSAQEVSATLKDKQIKIGEQTTIELNFRSTADGQMVRFPDLLDTISGKIEILEVSEIDTAYDEQDISIRVLSQTITITSWDSGFHPVPPFVFYLADKKYETKAQLLEVNTVALEAEADIKDIKDIMEVPFSLWDWILLHKYWFLGGLAVIVLALIIILLIKRFRKHAPEEKVVVPKEKADVVALRQLKALEAAEFWQKGKVNHYYTELSHILREYLENRFRLSALEKTTDEIEMLLRYHKDLEPKHREQFIELMQLCDMAKFAKQEPLASENKEALHFAYKFIEDTKMVEEDKSDISTPLDVTDLKSETGIIEENDRTRTSDSNSTKGNIDHNQILLEEDDKKEHKT